MKKIKWIIISLSLIFCFLLVSFFVFALFIADPMDMAKISTAKGDYDRTLRYCQRAILQSEKKKKDAHKIAEINRTMGVVYLYKKDVQKAEMYLNKALELDLKNYGENNENTLNDKLNLIASNYLKNKANPDKIINDYKSILNIINNKNNGNQSLYYTAVTCCTHIAEIYNDKNDFDTAIKYAEKSLDISLKMLDKNMVVIKSYNNLGSLYYNKQQYSKSLYYYNKALEFADKINLNDKYMCLKESKMNIDRVSKKIEEENINVRN
jgi:tetratricopeptide (TPR) repeat protein